MGDVAGECQHRQPATPLGATGGPPPSGVRLRRRTGVLRRRTGVPSAIELLHQLTMALLVQLVLSLSVADQPVWDEEQPKQAIDQHVPAEHDHPR